jgi:hypothetical protein
LSLMRKTLEHSKTSNKNTASLLRGNKH